MRVRHVCFIELNREESDKLEANGVKGAVLVSHSIVRNDARWSGVGILSEDGECHFPLLYTEGAAKLKLEELQKILDSSPVKESKITPSPAQSAA